MPLSTCILLICARILYFISLLERHLKSQKFSNCLLNVLAIFRLSCYACTLSWRLTTREPGQLRWCTGHWPGYGLDDCFQQISISSRHTFRPLGLLVGGCQELFSWGYSGSGLKLTTHLQTMSKLRMRNLYLHSPMSPQHGAELTTPLPPSNPRTCYSANLQATHVQCGHYGKLHSLCLQPCKCYQFVTMKFKMSYNSQSTQYGRYSRTTKSKTKQVMYIQM